MVGFGVGLMGAVLGLRIDTAVRNFYFDFNNDKSLWQYLSQMFTLLLLICLFSSLVLHFVGANLFQTIFSDVRIKFHPYGQIALSTLFLNLCSGLYFIYLKNKVHLKEFAAYSILNVILNIGFQVYFILILDMNILGVLYGNLVSAGIVFILVLLSNLRLLNFKIRWGEIKPSLVFSLPLIPFSFLFALDGQMDKWFLERYQTLEEVGIYAVLMVLVGLNKLLMNALDNGIRPFLFRGLKEGDLQRKQIVSLCFQFYLMVGLMALSFIIVIGLNFQWFSDNPKYLKIKEYILLASLVTIPVYLYRFTNLLLLYHKLSKELTLMTFYKTILLVILMLILIPTYGINGALVAFFVSAILNVLLFNYVLQKRKLDLLNYAPIFGRTLLFVILVGGLYSLCLYFGIKQFAVIQFVFVLLVFGILERKTITRFTRLTIK